VSPSPSSAKENSSFAEPRSFRPVTAETGDEPAAGGGAVGSSAEDDDPEATAGILKIFQQKLNGVRRLPRRQKAAALRAAREWLAGAMTDLRERRTYRRHAIDAMRRQERASFRIRYRRKNRPVLRLN
jgi:hypothetical protein